LTKIKHNYVCVTLTIDFRGRSFHEETSLLQLKLMMEAPKLLELPASVKAPEPWRVSSAKATRSAKQESSNASNSKKRKWARVQATELANSKFQKAEGQAEYNIWYNKYLGDFDNERHPATSRCVSERDAGLTRADLTNPNAFICIYFAKGCCVNGKRCSFLHRVPTPEDNARLDLMHDIFGRQRHAKDREDMGGVGSFNRDNHTIFITDISITSVRETEVVLRKHFGEWGEIEQLSVKPKYGCAFIRYRYRANAEFAKIAMAEQSLDEDEQINVRWAHEDPNPKVQKELQEHKENRVLQAVLRKT
jgi:hypothetical protein